jgi:hypothetical protein
MHSTGSLTDALQQIALGRFFPPQPSFSPFPEVIIFLLAFYK